MKGQAVIEKRDEYYAYGSVLEAVSRGLYPDRKHVLREFVQNAYDAIDDLREIKPVAPIEPIQITANPPSLIIADKGIGMSEETMKRYRYLGFSEKRIGTRAGFRGIGKFSAISACDRVIVSSSKLGDRKRHQVIIDAKGIFDRLQKEKNPPLEKILQEHSQMDSADEKPEEHYTVVELNGIRKDASELLDERIIKPYLVRTVPLPFDPAFAPGKEVSARLRQVDTRFLEVELLINGNPIYKPFLANASRPEYMEIFTRKGAQLIAYAWFCQNRDKGQFPKEDDDDETKAKKHPHSGLHYRMSNFAVGDSLLLRKTIWLTSPERAFHFFGEIHVLDAGVIPTSDRDDFEDNRVDHEYYPRNAYFVRTTKGCIRTCNFCAVPRLEKEFGAMRPLREQVTNAIKQHGERQHLVVMDNNILGIEGVEGIFEDIRDLGFQAGAIRKGRERTVDFNQGLDARLISAKPELAKMLKTVCVSPIRLAFDFIGIRPAYEKAIRLLVTEGFNEFTNYMLFNFADTPRDLYDRLWANANLNKELGVRITGFPMRFIPMDDVSRRHVAPGWKWRYLRGIQCVLLATRGLVSPNPDFIRHAFGGTFEDFLEILSMPDRYIIYREYYANDGAADWKQEFSRLSKDEKDELLKILQDLNSAPRERPEKLAKLQYPFRSIIEHYYPGGQTAPKTPAEEELAQQGVSVGYDSGPG